MKNKKMKRFSIFTAAFVALTLMLQGFAALLTDISHMVVHAIEGNVVYLTQTSVEATDTNLVYVDLVAKGAPGVHFDISYKTFSGTAIQGVDFNGVDNNISLTITANKT